MKLLVTSSPHIHSGTHTSRLMGAVLVALLPALLAGVWFFGLRSLALVGVEDRPGIAYKVFSLLGQKNINVDIIVQSIGRQGTQDISFTVRRSDVDQAVALLQEHKESLPFDHIDVDQSVVKVSIVGAGMVDNAGVAAKMFGALYDADINIHMISTSEIKVSVLVDSCDADRAVQVVYDRFYDEFNGAR